MSLPRSQLPYTQDVDECMDEDARSCLAPDAQRAQSRLRQSNQSRLLIARQFGIGGALDSQTSDSQFVRNLEQVQRSDIHEGVAEAVRAGDATLAANDSEERGPWSASASSSAPPPVATGMEVTANSACSAQVQELQIRLARSQRRVMSLEERLQYLRRLCSIFEERVHDLEHELDQEREDDVFEPYLDPNEESQVLVYPEPRPIKRRRMD